MYNSDYQLISCTIFTIGLKSCFCKLSLLRTFRDPLTSCSQERKHPVSSLKAVVEDHLMRRKDEKRNEAYFPQIKMNIPVIRDRGALNAYLCYCDSLTL